MIITVIIPKGGKLPDNYISSGTAVISIYVHVHTHTLWDMYMHDEYQWQNKRGPHIMVN